MRKILIMLLMAVTGIVLAEAKPRVKFASTNHDFGTIHEKNGRVTASYEFTNIGDEPLSITQLRAHEPPEQLGGRRESGKNRESGGGGGGGGR
ncbi:MAG: DUF1573 domain-containing protein, partial [Duncaniella sp.]|nr:DUF1573 domain-containing protein [Duncaniella sp.]